MLSVALVETQLKGKTTEGIFLLNCVPKVGVYSDVCNVGKSPRGHLSVCCY